jgi:hypothetical protein
VVTNGTRARFAASQADQAGARERACTISTRSLRITCSSSPALRQMRQGSREASGSVTWSAPRRSRLGTCRPPALATMARPPASWIAWAISSVPRSTPPVSSAGSTCSTVG